MKVQIKHSFIQGMYDPVLCWFRLNLYWIFCWQCGWTADCFINTLDWSIIPRLHLTVLQWMTQFFKNCLKLMPNKSWVKFLEMSSYKIKLDWSSEIAETMLISPLVKVKFYIQSGYLMKAPTWFEWNSLLPAGSTTNRCLYLPSIHTAANSAQLRNYQVLNYWL